MNNKGEVKIADFGLTIQHSASSARLCKPVTTLLYRAPEQVFEVKSGYDLKSDIWSLGCILVELIINEPLFCSSKTFQNFVDLLIARLGRDSFEGWLEVQESNIFKECKNRVAEDTNIREYIKTRKPMIDSHALDLIAKLLAPNPAQRLSIDQVPKHPYFESGSSICRKEDIPKVELECHEYTVRLAYLKKKMAVQAYQKEDKAKSGKSVKGVQVSGGSASKTKIESKKRPPQNKSNDPSELKRLKTN